MLNKIKLSIISVQTDNDKNYQELQRKYLKFLDKWAIVNLININTKNLYKKYSNDKKQLLKEEAKLLEKYFLKNNIFKIVLDNHGEEFTSENFSEFLIKESYREIYFFIGSSYGFADEIKEKADFLLSLSKLTFNHQLAKLLLLEQLYRALNIQHNGKYHK